MTLTPRMQEAIDFARANGGALIRLPGGFWCKPGGTQWEPLAKTFSTPTVNALVTRQVGEYTEWVDGRNGRFPVRITLKDCA